MLSERWTGLSVLYVCPIKALLNNLEPRLSRYAGLLGRKVELWHGDVSPARKRRLLQEPPDILLTTPESLEGMLISTRVDNAAWFANVRVAVVDELHAIASDDRGWHLRSVLTRVNRHLTEPIQLIGLSATVGNPERLLAWFAPEGQRRIVGSSAVSTDADVTIDHVGNLENAALVVSRMHRGEKRLVFCDSRSSAERLGSALNQLGIRTFVSHASLSASERRQAETAFSEERDCVIVATSTLELGIDVGDLDRVIQIDSPSTVGSFLQRMGRSGRRSGGRRNCLFLTTSQAGLMTALGVCKLWSQSWVEDALPPSQPWNVVAQQLILSTLERGRVAGLQLLEALGKAFPELDKESLTTVLQRLLEESFLAEDEGVIQIGIAAQQAYEGGHYRDLMATFSGAQLLAARHGNSELGYVDPSVLVGQKDTPVILLSGRNWAVREVDWKRQTVWLEPAKEGGKARWLGAGRDVGAPLAAAIRSVLIEGEVRGVTMSKRAGAALEELRDTVALPSGSASVEMVSPTRFRLWTFAGSVANRTTMLRQQKVGAYAFDGLTVSYRTDPRTFRDSTIDREQDVPDTALAELCALVKFGDLLPSELLIALVRARWLAEDQGREAAS